MARLLWFFWTGLTEHLSIFARMAWWARPWLLPMNDDTSFFDRCMIILSVCKSPVKGEMSLLACAPLAMFSLPTHTEFAAVPSRRSRGSLEMRNAWPLSDRDVMPAPSNTSLNRGNVSSGLGAPNWRGPCRGRWAPAPMKSRSTAAPTTCARPWPATAVGRESHVPT